MQTADAQADLSLRWTHMPFCWFCHEVAQLQTELIIAQMLVDTGTAELTKSKQGK